MSVDRPDVVLTMLTDEEFLVWISGYRTGYEHAHRRRDELEVERDLALDQHVARIVLNGLNEPPRDREADEARAARSSSWWAARRGEVA